MSECELGKKEKQISVNLLFCLVGAIILFGFWLISNFNDFFIAIFLVLLFCYFGLVFLQCELEDSALAGLESVFDDE